MDRRAWRRAKRLGFADAQLAWLWGVDEDTVRQRRLAAGVRPTFKTVDTCGAEFDAETPYHYSTYEDEDEVRPSDRRKVLILGSGPNRIGQGIEFDYCCVHASFALAEAGFETVMLNCNPETVSTDYDTSDRLYFEPLTLEDALNVIEAEQASGELVGVIVGLGGQTPLKLSRAAAGRTRARNIARVDRPGRGPRPLERALRPARDTAAGGRNRRRLRLRARRSSSASAIRSSYVPATCSVVGPWRSSTTTTRCARRWSSWQDSAASGKEGGLSAERPVLIDRFLEDATEVDVDAIRDRTGEVIIGGVMEHVEEAGVHSGDSACSIPPYNLSADTVEVIEAHTRAIATELEVVGLINVQYAVKGNQVFVIEANPRASRTVPFVAKATGVPLVKVAARVMVGASLSDLRAEGLSAPPVAGDHVAVKEAVLPFNRFPDADSVLGPEMRSTGEVMGIDSTFGLAFAKSQLAAGDRLPERGCVFISVADRDKPSAVEAGRRFVGTGFVLAATAGTSAALEAAGVPVTTRVAKLGEVGVDAVELISSGKVDLVVNSPRGRGPRADGAHIRAAAAANRVPCLTTAAAGLAAADGIADRAAHELRVRSLQEFHRGIDLRPTCRCSAIEEPSVTPLRTHSAQEGVTDRSTRRSRWGRSCCRTRS